MGNKKYEVVIVLANEMDSQGKLNDETQARVDCACQQMLKGQARSILLMGWDYRPDTSLCISDAMHEYIQKHYTFDPERVLLDRQSRDTVGDAIFSKLMLTQLANSKSICVVTSDYHQARTKIIFDFVYGDDWEVDVMGVPTVQQEDKQIAETASLEAFRQTFLGVTSADDDAIFEAMSKKHPFYNGAIHPKIALQ